MPDQIAPTIAEYRRWRYLRSLDPGHVAPPVMPWIEAWAEEGAPSPWAKKARPWPGSIGPALGGGHPGEVRWKRWTASGRLAALNARVLDAGRRDNSATLAAYRAEFGTAPPPWLWPSTAELAKEDGLRLRLLGLGLACIGTTCLFAKFLSPLAAFGFFSFGLFGPIVIWLNLHADIWTCNLKLPD